MGRLFCWVICTASKAYLVLNTKLFLSHTSFSSLLVCIICKISCHPAFAIHLVFDLGHSSSPTSLLACEYHKLFVPTCHTSLMEQTFSFSSSSLSVCYTRIQFSSSGFVPVIRMCHRGFQPRLNSSFSCGLFPDNALFSWRLILRIFDQKCLVCMKCICVQQIKPASWLWHTIT